MMQLRGVADLAQETIGRDRNSELRVEHLDRDLFAGAVGRGKDARIATPAQRRHDGVAFGEGLADRSEEHTSELQSQSNLVCRLLLEKKKKNKKRIVDIGKRSTSI